MSAAPPPNWYPDPHDRAQLRWWDGTQWTEHRHPVVSATPTAQEPPVEQPADAMTSSSTSPRLPVQVLPQPSPRPAPAPNRRPLIIGAGVIAVVVVAALVFALTRGGDSDDVDATVSTTGSVSTTVAPVTTGATATTGATTTTRAPATTTATATTAAPLAGTTFTDSTNVYRLRIPQAWSDATVVGGLQTWATGTGSSTFRDSVNVLIEKLPGDISMDDYLAASVRNAPKSLPSFVEVSRSVNTVNGKVLGQLDFRSNQNIPLRHRAVVLIKGRNAIVVTYTAEPTRFDAEANGIQPYLQSVEGV